MRSNAKPVSHAQEALLLPDARLLPEDIGYDSARSRFLLTSVLEKKIVVLTPDGKLRNFADSPDGWPMLALRIDARRGVVWATEVALDGFASVPRASWGRSAVLEYDLHSAKMLRRIDGPRSSQLGDMTIAPGGDPLVCDSNGGGVYTIREKSSSLTPIDLTDFISPMTPAFVSVNQAIVADYVRGIGLLDLAARRVDWIPTQSRFALEGVDGIYYDRGKLLAVQNGISPERVVVFGLDVADRRIISAQPIESGTDRLDPNHAVMVGSSLYFIANAGWNNLDAAGRVKKGASLTPARIMRFTLPDAE